MCQVFVSLLFGLLTLLICADQLHSVSAGVSPIDRLKGIKAAPPPSFWTGLEIMCGGKASILWMLPMHQAKEEMELLSTTEDDLADMI